MAGRTPTYPATTQFMPDETAEHNLAELHESQEIVSAADALVVSKMNAIKAIGQIESTVFMLNVAEKLIAEIAIKVREDKEYKGLPYKNKDGEVRFVANFQEYCEAFLGKSYRRIMELIANYKLLGPSLYEQAEKIGFTQRDYNALKALPEDDRKLITLAMEEENFEKALDLMQEMAVRHHAEKDAAKKKEDELKKEVNAVRDVLNNRNDLLNKKDEELSTLKQGRALETPEMRGAFKLDQLNTLGLELTSKISASLRSGIVQLLDEYNNAGEEVPKHIQLAAAQTLGRIITAAYGVAEDLGIVPETELERALDDPAKADAEILDKLMSGELVVPAVAIPEHLKDKLQG